MDTNETLLRAILSTVGRSAFRPKDILAVIAPRTDSAKQVTAYNMCDGKTPQSDICKKVKLDSSNFSKSLANWIEAGVVVRVGAEQLPLHIYPLSKENQKVTKE